MSKYYVSDRNASELLKIDPWPDGWHLTQVDSGQWQVETDGTHPDDEQFVRELSEPLGEPDPNYVQYR